MNKNFWLIFAIQTAVASAESAVATSTLNDAQKKALTDLIAAGQEVSAAFA